MMQITPRTQPIGLIGCPLGHSFSPQLHNAIYLEYGLDCIYLAFELQKDQLEDAVKGFKALSFLGFNVTVPYKQDILPFLDYVDPEAAVIGAVNTVKIEGGKLKGYNTDGMGFTDSLKHRGYDVRGLDVLLLGAGGSARAICAYIAKEGARAIYINNRTKSNALIMLADIKKHYPDLLVEYIDRSAIEHIRPDMIINTTCVGMWPDVELSPLEGYVFRPNQAVVDIIYNPQKTLLLKQAGAAGCNVVNGLDMLVGQAVKAIQIWTGVSVDHGYGLDLLLNTDA